MQRFIDTHVHLWDRTQVPYPWLDGFPSIAGRHTPAELRAELQAETGARFPDKILIVEGDCDRARAFDEVRAIETMASTEPAIAGIVAFAPMDRGAETIAALDRLRARPLVRGVRHLIQGEADPDFCRRPEFIAGVRAAGERGLSFDLCVKHHQLSSVVDLVSACPGTRFILDHAGKPDIRGQKLEPWREKITTLAWLPHVACKLSGLVTEADPAWTIDDLRPYVDHLLARFGAGRLIFGSDWPVVKLASSYQRWLDTALTLLSAFDAEDRDAILSANAQRIYRLS
jgi:L-fuconolactonase